MKINFRTALSKNRVIQIAIFSLVGSLFYSVSTPTPAWAAMPSSELRVDLRAGDLNSYNANSGNNWNDLSANSNDATRNGGATWSSTSGTFTFDGVDDYFQISGTPSSLRDFTSGISVSVSANFGNVSNWERLIDLSDGLNSDNNNIIFGRDASTNNLTVIFSDGSNYGSYCTASNAILNNVWATYAFVANGSTCKIYRDGLEIHSQNYRLPTNASRNTNFIGKSHISAQNTFEGGMRALAIYGRALSATEVNDARLVQEDPNCISGSDYTETTASETITLTFTTLRGCTWTGPARRISAAVAIVGGGGSGGFGQQGGGGGGGEVLYSASLALNSSASLGIFIGAGGIPATNQSAGGDLAVASCTYWINGANCGGVNGSPTNLTINGETITARGGGGGGAGPNWTATRSGRSGGSGGGASRFGTSQASSISSSYPGWTSYVNNGGTGSNTTPGGGGGGGGAGSAGASAVSAATDAAVQPGIGGSAKYLLGRCLAAGGTSFATGTNSNDTEPGCTGIATASNSSGGWNDRAGFANTGGGGAGSKNRTTGAGGSGVILIQYSSVLPTQTITFESITDKTFNTPSFGAVATTTAAGETVTVTSANTSICTYSGETVTLVSTGTCTLTASQAGSASVQAAASVVRSFTISKGTPTLGTFSTITKTYGDTSFNLETVTSTVQGLFSFTSLNTSVLTISGNSATVVGAGTANIRLLFTPTDTSRWETATVTGTITVNKKSLTVTASSPTVSFGSAIPTITPAYSGFANGENSTSVAVPPTCTTTYTTSSTVGSSPATSCSGGSATNYSFAFVSGVVTITSSSRLISFSTTTLSKTYGDDTFTVTAVPSIGAGDGSISYSKTGTACSVTTSGTVTILTAGSCSVFATISTGSNYDSATTSIPVAITIGRKALSISGSSISSKVYDGTRTPGALTVGTLSGLVAGESLTVTGTLSLLNSANADTYTVTATYTLGDGANGFATNYSLGTESLQAVVTKKALTITASSPTVAYGDGKPAITFEYSGFAGSDNSTNISQAPTCDTVYTTSSNYGSSPATSCSGATATNYTFTYVSGSVTITRVNLTVTASSHTLNYGDAVPTFTYTITGFKNSQTASVLSTLPTCTTTDYTNTSPRGSYYSRCSGAAATNYTFTYADGVITVNIVTRSVSLSVGTSTLTYGDSTTATFSMTGNQSDGSLALSVFSGSCQITGGRILATSGIDSCVIRATASGATSYSDTFTAVTITLAKKALTVSGTTIASRVYNGANTRGAITVGTVTGYVGSDNLTVNAAALDYSGSNVGTYSVTVQYTLVSTAQGTSSNYSLSSQSISGQITAKALTVTAPSLSRHFSQALPASLNPTITGFVNSETSSALSTIPTCITTYTTSSTVGSSQSTSCSGGVATNYTFTYVSGVVTVTTLVRTLEVTSNKASLVYGESAALTFSVSIGANDGAISVTISGDGCAFGVDSTTVTAVDPNGACTINSSITGGLNYNDAVAAPLTLSLTKKTLTISGLSTTAKTYDGTLIAPVSGGSLIGLINSDSVTVTTAARFADKLVGGSKPVTAIASISGSAAGKYTLVQPTLPSETITAATVTVSGLTVRSRPANGTRTAVVNGTPVLTGVVAGDTVSLINYSQGLFETSTVGDSLTVTISMSLSGTDSNNYTLSLTTYRADITIAYDNTITFASLPNISIGTSPFVLVASTTSGLQISFVSSGSACSLNGETVTILALGSCSITASQEGTLSVGGTVPAASPITRTFTVTTRAITITADDKTFIVGGRANPTYKISGGLISGDRINSVTIRYSGGGLSNSANAPTASGSYSINLSNALFANSARANLYTITYVSGSLVIFESTSKELTSLKVLTSGGSTTDLLQGAYSNSTTSYSLRVDYAVSSVLVTMARSNSTNVNAQVRINESGWRTLRWSAIVGGTTDSGVLPLPAATNTIALRLYGSDKEIDTQSRIITILIYRDQASRPVPNPSDTTTAVATFTDRINESTIPAAAAVSAISFTPNINFGLFDPNVDSYTATVARRISAITLITNFTGNGITVKISVNNGPQRAIPPTGKSETYALLVGSNTVTVRATSPDGSMQQYLFTITRAST